jgi:sensor histidine kinase regulating citrate/malate metabolism
MKNGLKSIGKGLWHYTKWVSKQTSSLLNAIFILMISSSIGTFAGTILLIAVIILGGYELAIEEQRNAIFNEMTESLILINGKSGEILMEN